MGDCGTHLSRAPRDECDEATSVACYVLDGLAARYVGNRGVAARWQ
jgi:hypothetical protein